MSEKPVGPGLPLGPEIPPVLPLQVTRAARLRWTTGQAVEETLIDPVKGGVILIPAPGVAAQLATLFLEAQDEAAISAKSRVRVSHGEVEVFLDIPEGWPSPAQPPSLVLGGGMKSRRPGQGIPDRLAAELVTGARLKIGKKGVDLVLAYPRRRRALAGVTRRLETDMQRLAKELRALQIRSHWFLGGAALGLAGSALAAFYKEGNLVMAGGGLMAGAAAAWALDQLSRARRTRHQTRLKARLQMAVQRAERLDDLAFRLTRSLGAGTIWDLSARLERALQVIPDGLEPTHASPRAREWAGLLAGELGVPADELTRPETWFPPTPAESCGWPLEVSRSTHEASNGQIIAGMATLLDRTEDMLPAPWPLVVYEPWPGDTPDQRARRLMALSHLTPNRPILAFITP